MISPIPLRPLMRRTPCLLRQRPVIQSVARAYHVSAPIHSFQPAPRSWYQRPAPLSRPSALAVRPISSEVQKVIESAVASAPVVLFMKGTPELPQCGFSQKTIQILSLQGVDPNKFRAYNVLEDNEVREGIKEFSDWPTIPQLYVKGEFVGGCDILMSMHTNGELSKLLEEADALVVDEGGDEQPEDNK